MRIVAYRIKGRDVTVTLATTLFDHRAAPAAELALPYHERREIETAYDEAKTHILGPGAVLRSKTPDLARQEIDGLMLPHYTVRCLIHGTANKAGEDPDRISFVHAVRVMRRRIINPGTFPPKERPAGVIDEILEERAVSSRGQFKAQGRQAENERLPPPQAWPGIAPETRLDTPVSRIALSETAFELRCGNSQPSLSTSELVGSITTAGWHRVELSSGA